MLLEPISATMTETRSISALNDKITYLTQASDQHDQELHGIHQKLDAVTGMLQTLTQTMQGLTEAGSQWQRQSTQSTPLEVPSSLNHQDTTLATIPQSVKLEFPKFRGENPSG